MVDTTVSSSNESNSLIVCNMKYLAILAITLFAIVAAEPEAEADAEAAAAYYGGYYGHYAPLVAGASSHQHVSTPAATYGISQIHKRSADAEPEADAEAAAAYYGGYYGRGYGYGYGLGYRGYYGRGYYGYPGYGYGYGRYFG